MRLKVLYFIILFISIFPFLSHSQNSYSLFVKMPDPVSMPVIKTVSVTSENKNLITWQNSDNQNIQYYNIYRDGGSNDNNWVSAGIISYPCKNEFLDKLSFSGFRSYKYRISATDLCGNEIFSIREHKTINLTIDKNDESSYELKWNFYEGFNADFYNIYRGSDVNSLQLVNSLPSTFNTFIDDENTLPDIFYKVEAVAKYRILKSNEDSVKTSSNIVSAKLVLNISDSAKAGNIIVFPNPMKYSSMVFLPFDENESRKLYLCSLDGKIVYSQEIKENEIELKRGNLKEGIYLLKIIGKKTYYKKIILGGIQ